MKKFFSNLDVQAFILTWVVIGLVNLLPSCVTFKDGFGAEYAAFGGSGTVETPAGGRLTHSHTKTAQHFFQAVVSGIGLGANAAVQASDNALKEVQARQATAAAANARVPTIVPAQAVKPDTTVFPLVVPPAKPIVP